MPANFEGRNAARYDPSSSGMHLMDIMASTGKNLKLVSSSIYPVDHKLRRVLHGRCP